MTTLEVSTVEKIKAALSGVEAWNEAKADRMYNDTDSQTSDEEGSESDSFPYKDPKELEDRISKMTARLAKLEEERMLQVLSFFLTSCVAPRHRRCYNKSTFVMMGLPFFHDGVTFLS